VSPYLNLYRPEDEESAPNYFAFVRPQLDQISTNQRQQMEMQRLDRQVQGLEWDSRRFDQGGGPLTTGHSTRFMNTGSYFGR
jgi:hypothetical protein